MNKKIHRCFKRQRGTARAALCCLMLLLLYGCGSTAGTAGVSILGSTAQEEQEQVLSEDGQDSPDSIQEDVEEKYTVYVCGAVAYPGVYELPVGSRIYQALALAGGMTVDAAPTAVNQAEPLTDGEMIQIPTVEEEQEQQAEEQERSDGLVNINTATLEELKTLPGIGDARARSIIAYRESNGAFASIQDIKNIDGIGDGMFSKLESCIKVN